MFFLNRLWKIALPLATATGAIASTTSLVILYNKNSVNQGDLDKELQDFEKPSQKFEEKTEFLKKEEKPAIEEKKEKTKEEKKEPSLAEVLWRLPLVLANITLGLDLNALQKLKDAEIPEEGLGDFDPAKLKELTEGMSIDEAIEKFKEWRDAQVSGEEDLGGTADFTAPETLSTLLNLKDDLSSIRGNLASQYSIENK